jgi:hypothetical protein
MPSVKKKNMFVFVRSFLLLRGLASAASVSYSNCMRPTRFITALSLQIAIANHLIVQTMKQTMSISSYRRSCNEPMDPPVDPAEEACNRKTMEGLGVYDAAGALVGRSTSGAKSVAAH